ncbi:MAG: translation initiation factor eIF-1A [archaeon]|nr:translation initiation factor eIF-1A [archaeon]
MTEELNNEEFGEGESQSNNPEQPNQPLGRVRLPRGNEVLGKVEQRLGANRMLISCFDGKQRNCRVPGRLKRALWIRPGNIVLVQPWEYEGDKKGDIMFSYNPAAVQFLEKRGYLKGVKDEF